MRCPGQDPRFWKFDAIFETPCPNCGSVVEFFKDETRRTCKKCGHKVLNPKMDFGCAAHCKFAEQCFGELPPELIKEKEDLFKDRIAVEAKRHFMQDFKRIAHAARVARYAEKLAEQEKCDPAVVLSAAYLHEVGSAQEQRQTQGPPAPSGGGNGCSAPKDILVDLGAGDQLVHEVCRILGLEESDGTELSLNFKVFHDADLIAELEEKHRKEPMEEGALTLIIEREIFTQSGKELATSILLSPSDKQDLI